MLRRLGKKTKLLNKLIPLFPDDISTFIDMFMGSGAVSFAMIDKAKQVIANDKDDNVFNLFMVVKDRKDDLLDALVKMPVHESLLKHWKKNEEVDPVWKAVRFLMLSNFGYMGFSDIMCFRYAKDNSKSILLEKIDLFYKKVSNMRFMCCDFRNTISKIEDREARPRPKRKSFIYADPPYIGTMDNYDHSFTEQDVHDLFGVLVNSGVRFGLSGFRHPLVDGLAEENALCITSLGERRSLGSRTEEILITNYETGGFKQKGLFV